MNFSTNKLLSSCAALFALLLGASSLQAQCPDCTINLPPMPADTVYLDSIPDGVQNQYYEEQISFRLPYTTAPLRALDPSVPALTVSLESFTILGITGLPIGLSWKLDRPSPAIYNETAPDTRDGCVTICGTPIQADSFTVNIAVEVNAGALGTQPATIPVRFFVARDTGVAISFTPATGCAPIDVEFEPVVMPQPNQTAEYAWDFGNGETSDQATALINYPDTGLFEVNYQAVYSVEIPRTLLSSVSITQAPCNDNVFGIPGAPDIYIIVSSPTGTDTTTNPIPNQTPSLAQPVVFNFGQSLQLRDGEIYTIDAKDDDENFGGIISDDDCGAFSFNSDTLLGQPSPIILNFTDGQTNMIVELIRDTIYLRDTFTAREFVYADPCNVSIEATERIERSFRIFPNPSTDGRVFVKFDLGQEQADKVELQVFDMMGRLVRTEQLGSITGEYRGELDLSSFGSGMYIMQLQTEGQRMQRKLILR